MRSPKGFGKNYFSLSSICAHSSASVLHAQCTAFTHASRNFSFETLEEDEEPLIDELELIECSSPRSKSSSRHCNCYFKRLLYILTQLFKFHPQTFFIHLYNRSGIAPPFSFLFSYLQTKNKIRKY
ncbi:MAG: hypothetical protein IBX43_05315 [Campylobacterales bacterium]|nr:hypothetical protein [Campylobacterales bacterium]